MNLLPVQDFNHFMSLDIERFNHLNRCICHAMQCLLSGFNRDFHDRQNGHDLCRASVVLRS